MARARCRGAPMVEPFDSSCFIGHFVSELGMQMLSRLSITCIYRNGDKSEAHHRHHHEVPLALA